MMTFPTARPSGPRSRIPLLLALLAAAALVACRGEAGARSTAWSGTIDTLASGRIAVTNPPEPIWGEGEGWSVTEELRIGALEDSGPFQFGQVRAVEADAFGRIWVLESQAKEIRVFDAAGHHVRTIGREGGGPGEFADPADIAFGPDGLLWVPDPQNNRVSVIDTTGVFVTSHRIQGGFSMSPWPGGFDDAGRYYLPVPYQYPDGEFAIANVRYDRELVPLDTVPLLRNPNPPPQFQLVEPDGDGRLIATVPFSAGLTTAWSPRGTAWGMMTGDYRLFEVGDGGDTLRTIQASYDPLPVTAADRAAALEDLSWFTDQGGKVDPSLMPRMKPAASDFFFDDAGRIWVDRITARPPGQDYDVFDPEGRLLGRVELPSPLPRIRKVVGDAIYGVTEGELGVPYVVRDRIDRAVWGSGERK